MGRTSWLDGRIAVAAHSLLNSTAVVISGVKTLQERWRPLAASDRELVLDAIHAHASKIDDVLRGLIQGRLHLGNEAGSGPIGGPGDLLVDPM